MKNLFLRFILFYQKVLRQPLLQGVFLPNTCRFLPHCSDYSYEAIQKYGILRGTFKGLWRILRCNPFSKGGYDPVK